MKTTLISASCPYMHTGSKIAEHTHIFYQIYYILEGSAVFVVNGKKLPVSPGSFFYIPSQTPHKMLTLKDSGMLSMDFKIQINDPFLLSHLREVSEPYQDNGYIKNMLDYVYANWKYKDSQNLENMDTIFTSLLMNFFLDELQYNSIDSCRIITKNYNPLSKSVIVYIENNYQKKFSLQELAETLGHNQNYISASFSKNTGVSVVEYLNLIRVRHAMILITFFLQDIFTAYESVGFSNPSHFSRTFKAFVGTTPRNVRYVFSKGDRDELTRLFANEPILNFRICTLEEAYASLRSIGIAVNRMLQEYSCNTKTDHV